MDNNPVAIVTGSSRGIGKGIALELASLGYDIVVTYLDFTPDGRADDSIVVDARAEITARGVRCEIIRSDVSNGVDRRELISFTKDRFGRCDMLVNNAGAAPLKRTDLLAASEESFDRVMSINCKGPYFLTQLAANWMIQQQKLNPTGPTMQFRIINISSISAYASSWARGEYCMSKAAVSMMTSLYADRLAEYGIGVFEIRPGVIATDMTSVVKDKYDKLIAGGLTPIRRWGLPEDIGRAVAAIAEGKLDFSTGQVINVDGGFHLRRL